MTITEQINEILRLAGMDKRYLIEGIEEVKRYFPSIPSDMFKTIAQLDPTYKGGNELGRYCKWLFTRYNQMFKQGVKPNIDSNIKNLLTTYSNFKKQIGKPIDQIKTIDELKQITNQYQGQTPELSNRQKKQQIRQDAEKWYEDDEWLVVIPKTKEASCFYGANTKWCTAGRNNNMFNSYNKQGPLFININKKTGEKYQFQFQSKEYRDAQDDFVDLSKVFMKMPKELQEKYANYGLKYDGFLIKYIDNPSEQVQLEAVKENGYAIDYIKNPSEQVQIEAVKQDGSVISYIKNPSEQVQIEAVKENGYAIKYIKNPSEKLQLEAVKKYSSAIKYIKNPSEKLQLEAVKEYGYAIQYIKNPSEQVQIEAVKENGYAIMYIDNPSEQVQLESVKQNGNAIDYIKNPSEELQLIAVKQKGNAIKYIKNPSERIQLEAVKEDVYAIQYIKNPTPSVIKYYEEHK